MPPTPPNLFAQDYNLGYCYARQNPAAARNALSGFPSGDFPPDWVQGRTIGVLAYVWAGRGMQDALDGKAPAQFADRPPRPQPARSSWPAGTDADYIDGYNFALANPPDAQIQYSSGKSDPNPPKPQRLNGLIDGLTFLASLDQAPSFRGAGSTPQRSAAYQDGYNYARENPQLAQQELANYPNPPPGPRAERNQGIRDGLATLGYGGNWPSSQAPPFGGQYLEAYASEWGRGIPLDIAEQLQQGQVAGSGGILSALLGIGLRFELLGDGPRDARQGFHLSGPNGPIARAVQRLIATRQIQPDPSIYGLPAWVGARTTKGLKLLGALELQRLGLL